MAKKNRKYVCIFILILIALYIIIYVIPSVTGALETTEILEAGSLQGTEETVCYFVRDEYVYAAKQAGELKYRAKEGAHVRKGTRVAVVREDGSSAAAGDKQKKEKSRYGDIMDRLSDRVVRTEDGRAETSGVVSYYADGYESFLTPDKMESLTYDDVKNLKNEARNTRRKSTLKGEPLFKISNNDSWYLMCWVEAASVARYETGGSVTIQLAEGDVKAVVENIMEAGDQWKIIFRSNRYYKDFSRSRVENARIVAQDYSGLIAENGSITTKDGQPGVMVRQKDGEFVFTRVKILTRSGDYSVLKDESFIDEDGNTVSTVKVYDEILKNPGKGT